VSSSGRTVGKWDNSFSFNIVGLQVGGGLSVGYNVLETALKEAAEEAGVPETLLQDLKPGGCVT